MTASTPEAAGFDRARLDRAYALVQRWVDADQMPAATLCVGTRSHALPPRLFGRQRPDQAGAIRPDALFLIASITKPITCTAVMLLAERGRVALHDRVAEFVPRFAQNDKQDVTLHHLLTHTSGLPDMLPENDRLRREHRPLSTFIDGICKLPLLFRPGTQVNYQSMGTAMLRKVVRQVAGVPLPEFLRREIFEPLGMNDTSLGWQPAQRDRLAAIRLPNVGTDWGWNSPYWLGFGAPWGGLITSPADLARFCRMMLNGGTLDDVRVLSPATVRAMTTNQLVGMPELPEADRRCRPWGLGWRLNWPGLPDSFGDLLGPRSYGHWGATGTLCWLDPDAETFFILFTTHPLEGKQRMFARLSNAVMAARTR